MLGGFAWRAEDHVALPCARSLFPPRQAIAVRVEARHHVGVPIAIDVVAKHVRATELDTGGMARPGQSVVVLPRHIWVFRVLVPTGVVKDVDATIGIHVADTDAVVEVVIAPPRTTLRHASECPEGVRRFAPVCLDVTHATALTRDELRPAVSGDVAE